MGVNAAAARAPGSIPDGDWPTFGYDAQRSGVGPALTGITAGDLALLRRRIVQLDGTVDSAALQLRGVRVAGRVRDVIVVTTTYGKTIAIDPRSGRRLWEYTPADMSDYVGTYQVTTATPVADPDRRYVYAASPDGVIHKLALATGHEVRSGRWPVRVTFSPQREKIAGALNIADRALVVVTGGYFGDQPVYQGHVVLIDRVSGLITAVWNSLCSDVRHLLDPPSRCAASDSAIWARGGAVVERGASRILVATGNGPFNGATDWGDSVLELAATDLRLLANWTPVNQAQLNAQDTDVGSTSPAPLPEIGGLRLAVQGGKDGLLALLDLDRLNGGSSGAGPRTGGQLAQIASPGGDQVYTVPAVWRHAGRTYVFVADNSGTAAYVLEPGPRLGVAWHDATPGTSPVLAGGLLYVYDQLDGALIVREPVSGRSFGSLAAGPGHWNSPIVVGGRIILPQGSYMDHATSGLLNIYYLPGR
jgi:outer membrane protein assembly factor BamB